MRPHTLHYTACFFFAGLRSETFSTVTTVVLSLIVMALSANIIALTEPVFYYKFSALGLATGLMTILTVIPMYDRANAVVGCITEMPSPPFALRFLIDMDRQGSFFSYIVLEISWLCKFLCLARFCMSVLIVISFPLGSLVGNRILCRLDGWSNH